MTAAVVWFTGRPASGKTTLALAVRDELRARGTAVAVLDSDEIREAIEPRYGYGEASRDDFYTTLANLAHVLARQDLVALVAATANLQRYRSRAREQCPVFVEVYVDTPLATCISRDPKGLYAQAAASSDNQLPGVGAVYEAPEAAEVVVEPADDEAVDRVIAAIRAASSAR